MYVESFPEDPVKVAIQKQRSAFFQMLTSWQWQGVATLSNPMRDAGGRDKVVGEGRRNSGISIGNVWTAGLLYDKMRTDITKYFSNKPLLLSKINKKIDPLLTNLNLTKISRKIANCGLECLPTENQLNILTLVYSTLKNEDILTEILEDSNYFNLHSDLTQNFSHVMVTSYILLESNFETKPNLVNEPKLDIYQDGAVFKMASIVDDVIKEINRLAASYARLRIKLQIHLSSKKSTSVSKTKITFWINSLNFSKDSDLEEIIKSTCKNSSTDYIMNDKLFSDVMHSTSDFGLARFVEEGKIWIQDKCLSVLPHSIRTLLNNEEDILLLGSVPASVAVHLASLMGDNNSRIFVCLTRYNAVIRDRMKACFKLFRVKSKIKILDFDSSKRQLIINSEELHQVGYVGVMANCSRSSIKDPVKYIVAEEQDIWLIRDKAYTLDETKLKSLHSQHINLLLTACLMENVRCILYSTLSSHSLENEKVIKTAIEKCAQMQPTWNVLSNCPHPLPISEEEIEDSMSFDERGLYLGDGEDSSRSFLSVLCREINLSKQASKIIQEGPNMDNYLEKPADEIKIQSPLILPPIKPLPKSTVKNTKK